MCALHVNAVNQSHLKAAEWWLITCRHKHLYKPPSGRVREVQFDRTAVFLQLAYL